MNENIEIMENNNSPKKNKGLIVIIILLIIALLGTVGYILVDKGVIFKKEEVKTEEKKEEKKENNNEVKNEEKELTDTLYIKLVNDDVDLLSTAAHYNKVSLSEEERIFAIIKKFMNDADNLNGSKIATVTDLDKKYEDLFNTKINNYTISDAVLDCYDFKIDKSKNIITGDLKCGFGFDRLLHYINKITEDDNNIYAYVNVGYFSVGMDTIVYSSMDKTNIVKKFSDGEYSALDNEYNIDHSNYTQFSEYKMTFVKNGDNIYYKNIERIK